MSGFAVNTGDLGRYSDELSKQRASFDRGIEYMTTYTTLPAGTADSLYARFVYHHREIRATVHRDLGIFARVLGGSAQNLIKIKNAYQSADAATEAAIDRSVPGQRRPADNPINPAGATFTSVDAAHGLADPPAPLTDYPDILGLSRALLDFISGSGAIEEIVTREVGFDPYERVGRFVVGDWKQFSKVGIAFQAVGAFLEYVAENVDGGNRALAKTWHGNAADRAYDYFDCLAGHLHTYGHALGDLSRAYDTAADAAYLGIKGISDLIHSMTDDVAEASALMGGADIGERIAALLHLPEKAARILDNIGICMGVAETLMSALKALKAKTTMDEWANKIPVGGVPYEPPAKVISG